MNARIADGAGGEGKAAGRSETIVEDMKRLRYRTSQLNSLPGEADEPPPELHRTWPCRTASAARSSVKRLGVIMKHGARAAAETQGTLVGRIALTPEMGKREAVLHYDLAEILAIAAHKTRHPQCTLRGNEGIWLRGQDLDFGELFPWSFATIVSASHSSYCGGMNRMRTLVVRGSNGRCRRSQGVRIRLYGAFSSA